MGEKLKREKNPIALSEKTVLRMSLSEKILEGGKRGPPELTDLPIRRGKGIHKSLLEERPLPISGKGKPGEYRHGLLGTAEEGEQENSRLFH